MELKTYASGDGSLSFTWLEGDKSTGRKVTEEDARSYLAGAKWLLDKGFKAVFINGFWCLARGIERINAYTLRTSGIEDGEGGDYEYSIDPIKCINGHVSDYSLTIYFKMEVDGKMERFGLKNQNIRSSIMFFLNNEEALKDSKELEVRWLKR